MIVKLVIIDNETNNEIYSEEYQLEKVGTLEDLADLIANRIIQLEESYPPEKYSIEQIVYYNP
ncbi:MAG: hypothetical protein QXY79_02305 [Candidatus Methanomethylicia archaeon]